MKWLKKIIKYKTSDTHHQTPETSSADKLSAWQKHINEHWYALQLAPLIERYDFEKTVVLSDKTTGSQSTSQTNEICYEVPAKAIGDKPLRLIESTMSGCQVPTGIFYTKHVLIDGEKIKDIRHEFDGLHQQMFCLANFYTNKTRDIPNYLKWKITRADMKQFLKYYDKNRDA